MEWPPDKERLKSDYYIMAGSLAVMMADMGVILAADPKNGWVKAGIAATALPAAVTGMFVAERMWNDDYGRENHQLTIYDEPSLRES